MRRLVAFLALSAGMTVLAGGAHADTFVNGSFETGDLQGWTTGGGYWPGGAYPVPSDYLPGGPSYDSSYQVVTVTNPGFDALTDNTLRTAYAGNHSAQVNNPINDNSVGVISQRVNNYTDSIIAFAYSAVLQDSHGPTDSDAFIITLTDVTTNESLFTFNLNSATAPGVFTQSSSNWYYTDWLTQSIDVSTRQGHDFVLSLLANDCPYGGHAGYAYLDGFGSVVGGGGTGSGGGGPITQFQYWDGSAAGNTANGIVDGGDGVWNAQFTNWTDPSGTVNGTYTPNPGSAVFAGMPGTVTVDDTGGQIAVNGLQFAVNGYTIVGDAIELGGTVATVLVGDGTAAGAGFVATIDAPLIGTGGLTKIDDGTLVLNGVNTYTGTTTVTGGTLVGSATSFGTGAINNDATLVIAQPTSADFTNRIMGSGSLFKSGAGTLRLTSVNPFAGTTTVIGGTLQVDGDLGASPVTVGNGATLAGSGTVGAVSALAGSRVAPGTAGGAPATLTVAGTYAQSPGSTYAVDLTSAGQSDLIAVGGGASVANSAVLAVTKTDATRYALGRRYTVLNAAGGFSGKYTLTGDTAVSLFYNVVDRYDATHVYLDVAQTRSFASAGLTPNQIAAAGGADSSPGAMRTAIAYLQTEAAARAAFDQVSGEIHATARAAAFEDSRFIREAVLGHTGTVPGDTQVGPLWFHGFGSWGHMEGDGNAARYSRNIGGAFTGYDLVSTDGFKAGALVGYSHAKLKVPARASYADADDYHVGAYASYGGGGGLGVRIGGSYTFRNLDTTRSPAFTGFSDQLKGSYKLGIAQAFGEIGYALPVGGAATFEPIAGLAYVHLDGDDETESGGSAALHLSDNSQHILFSTLGARVRGQVGGVRLNVGAAWRHAANNRGVSVPLAFAGGSAFSIAGVPIAKDVAALDAGVDANLAHNITGSLSYSGQLGEGLSDNGVKAAVTLSF